MTDKAVSQLTALTGANVATGDLLYIVDISEAAAADRSKKITAEELQNYLKKFPATIGVGGATPAASGAGISFPATASASSDANTLDDYEEGDCSSSIAIIGTGTPGTGTYTVKSGRYVKVGALVTVYGYMVWSAHTGTTDLEISGLPFSINSQANSFVGVTVGYVENLTLTANNTLLAFGVPGTTRIAFYQYTGGSATTIVPMDTAAGLIFSITYSV